MNLRVLVSVLFVSLVLAGSVFLPAPCERDNLTVLAYEKVKNSVVVVKAHKPNVSKPVISTGIVVNDDGLIVTAQHAVAHAKEIAVLFADSSSYVARIVCEDASSDLVILKISTARKLVPLSLAYAGEVKPGELVTVLGHPFGYSYSVSTGVVSPPREIDMPGGEILKDVIQHSAPINPGNSGGPLLNVNSELVGINVALRQDAQGIGFAVPVKRVKALLAKAKEL